MSGRRSHRSRRGQRQAGSIAGLAVAACAVGLAGFPAAAGATCSQVASINKVASYGGTAGMSYVSGRVSRTVDSDGDATDTISLNHHASDMHIVGLKPPEGGGSFTVFGQPSGGTVTVNDTFNETSDADGDTDLDSPPSSSTQTYSGPNVAQSGDQATIDINESNCTYQVSFSFDVPTTTAANGALAPNQPGEGEQTTSHWVPIPASLTLEGNENVPAVFGGDCTNACYDLSGDPGWGGTLELDAGSPTTLPGTATMSWHLTPGGSSAECVVPRLTALSESVAKRKIRSAACAVGTISHKHSKRIRKGHVISSRPKAGTIHSKGTTINLVISSGR